MDKGEQSNGKKKNLGQKDAWRGDTEEGMGKA